MSMCKLCGAVRAETDLGRVELGGISTPVCRRCIGRNVPMMHPAPGRKLRPVP